MSTSAPSPTPITTSTNNQIQRGRSERKPLQPKNSSAISHLKIKPKNAFADQYHISNKENLHPLFPWVAPPAAENHTDSSLAEELSAVRRKKERLRVDKEKTESILNARSAELDMRTNKLLLRGEIQKQLETEVDRLYRLKELKLFCLGVSPIRSLREKEEQKKTVC